METLQFLVQGSAETPYTVTFQKDGNKLLAFCTCPAGDNGQFCKHRTEILASSRKGIVSVNSHQVAVVASWLPGTTAATAIEGVNAAEREVERAKAALIAAKKNLAAVTRS